MGNFSSNTFSQRHTYREQNIFLVLCLTFPLGLGLFVLLALCWWIKRLFHQGQIPQCEIVGQQLNDNMSTLLDITRADELRPQDEVLETSLLPNDFPNLDRRSTVQAAKEKLPKVFTTSLKQTRRQGHLVNRSPPTEFVAGTPPAVNLPGIRDLPVPPKVHCKLIITIDGSDDGVEEHVHHRIFLIEWQKASSFDTCVKAAEGFLGKLGGATHLFYRNSWRYRIMKQQRQDDSDTWAARRFREKQRNKTPRRYQEVEVYAESIEKREEWREQLPHNLGGILHSDRDATYFLELNLSYTRYSPHAKSSCSGRGCLAAIRSTLFHRRVRVEENSPLERWFVPGKFIHNYFTVDLIDHLVKRDEKLNADPTWKEASPGQRETFVVQVSLFCTRLLATAIYANLDMRCVFHLWRHGKKDVNIPLLTKDKSLLPQDVDTGFFETFINFQGSFKAHSFPNPSNEQALPATDDDTSAAVEQDRDPFEEQSLLGGDHDITASSKHESIHPRIVVPIIEQSFVGQGSNAEVYKVRIHGDHHKFSPDRGKLFALKRIVRSSMSTNIHHESKILQKLDRVPHPHLTPLITSWSQGECCSMLLPLADGNLHDFLRRGRRPVLDGTFVTWLLRQMTGLAAALDHIHNLGPADLGPANEVMKGHGNRSNSGYHHDLHPRNILVFDGDALKISDFGTARLQQVPGSGLSNSASYQSRQVQCCLDYEAPDWTLTKKASRPHDVWALGCIFLEMLVWATGGNEEVDKFHNERLWADETKDQHVHDASFWYARNDQGLLKSAVSGRLTSLKQQFEGKFVFKTLIKLVEGMLRIETDPQVQHSRLQIAAVRSVLEKQISQAELDLRDNPTFFLEEASNKSPRTTYAPPSSIVGRGCNTASELGAPGEQDLDDGHLKVPATPRRSSTSDLQRLKTIGPSMSKTYLSAARDQQSDLARTGDHFESINGHGLETLLPDTPTIVVDNEGLSTSSASPAFQLNQHHRALVSALHTRRSQQQERTIDRRDLLPPHDYPDVKTWSRSVGESAGRGPSFQDGFAPSL